FYGPTPPENLTPMACTSKSRAPMHVPVRPKLLGRPHDSPGRIAQRESVPFTRERSKVRSLVRPPFLLPRQEKTRFGLASGPSNQNIETNPMQSSRWLPA